MGRRNYSMNYSSKIDEYNEQVCGIKVISLGAGGAAGHAEIRRH